MGILRLFQLLISKMNFFAVKINLVYLLASITNGEKINIIDVTKECREPCDGKGTFEPTFRKDDKNMDLTLDTPVDLNNEDTFIMKVHQYNEDTDEWEYYTEQDGVICQYIEQFLSKAWDKAKINANPEIKETCGLLKGKYQWTNFELNDSDVIVPLNMQGIYLFDVTVYSGEDTVICFQLHIEINA
ncbi:unnamed protein product [Tenebrio molitor]|nr:unnamed protein product [Tenebrio molitor]